MSRIRIVGGDWRGRYIEAPDGRNVTRPTTDRTRESMASMLMSACGLELAGQRVLDAFAGSGAIGLELLSRGAQSCCFVERDRPSAARVRRNVQSLAGDRADSVARVVCGDALKLARRGGIWGSPFSIVVLDPPYALPASTVSDMVVDLGSGGLLVPGCLVLYERSTDADELALPGARLVRSKSHGITTVTLFQTQEA
ncbi:RsmD family RNA methyltransferase [Olsenella phocaeensis]|uniref:RsmD family RNA methyltransferase n=1 Tax=Olsenella phocaeensis TaxID=1852385 RepID=UPI003A946C45